MLENILPYSISQAVILSVADSLHIQGVLKWKYDIQKGVHLSNCCYFSGGRQAAFPVSIPLFSTI